MFGGNRIGSGDKMTFNTDHFNRSTHNLRETFRSTMASGTLVPFMVQPMLPGDTMDINLECDVRTLPTIGPLFGSFKVQLDVYQIPLRLYMRDLQMNKLEIGRDMSVVKFPLMKIQTNDISLGLNFEYSKTTPYGGKEINNCQIEPSTILSYLGIKGVGQLTDTSETFKVERLFNAVPWLMYWDIYKQYYSNKMEDDAYYIHNDLTKQVDLISNAVFISNTTQVTILPDVAFLRTVQGLFTLVLSFDNWKNYEQFLEEELTIKFDDVSGTENDRTLKGVNDLIIQRNSSQLKIYYTNKAPYIVNDSYNITVSSDIVYDWERPNLETFPLKNIDVMREKIMTKTGNTALIISENDAPFEPYSSLFYAINGADNTFWETTSLQCKQEGLGIKTYQSDVFNNWLNTDWISGDNGVNAITAIQTDEAGKFTLDEFNIKKKVYDMLNHIVASGGTYDDWQDTIWGVSRMRQINSPVYEGGLSKELVFQEVISNSASDVNGEQALGTLAGRGVMGGRNKGGRLVVKATEPAYLMGIVSITPRIDYSQGNSWHTNLKNMSELHNPYLDAIGYQDLITDTMAYWDTFIDSSNGAVITRTVGKQPAWINYQTNFNKVYGNFALQNEQMFMVLNRRYSVGRDGEGQFFAGDITTYIDPKKFNHIFADTSADAQNFWVQIGIENDSRRIMSANQIPNL